MQFPVQAEKFLRLLPSLTIFAAMPPWQSWGQSSWNNWRDDKNKYQFDSDEALQYPEVETPNTWKSTNTFCDENVSFGLQFHRTIQPTSWSRKRGLTGLDPLKVPIGLLTRHGASEFGLIGPFPMDVFLASSVAGMFQKQFLVVSYFGLFVKPKLTLILLQSLCTESLIPKGSCLPRRTNLLLLWNPWFKK